MQVLHVNSLSSTTAILTTNVQATSGMNLGAQQHMNTKANGLTVSVILKLVVVPMEVHHVLSHSSTTVILTMNVPWTIGLNLGAQQQQLTKENGLTVIVMVFLIIVILVILGIHLIWNKIEIKL